VKIPLLDLKFQHDPLYGEILTALENVARSNIFILGPEVQRLEHHVAEMSGTKYGIGVSSGTDALLMALMALDISPGDEVITPTFSFFATAGAVARLGAKPVFVDVDPRTMNVDPAHLERVVTPRTKAIIPVHLYGQCADMDPILAMALRRNIAVIEDAAQAIGAQYRDGRKAGSMGVMGCLSFFPSKNLGAFGDGGMVLTNDEALAERLRLLRVHGAKPKYYHRIIGGNFRLDACQAAVLNVKLPHLIQWTRQRQENAKRYDALFEQSGLMKGGLRPPVAVYAETGCPGFHIYNQYVIRVPERDRLQKFLKERQIETEIYYPLPFHMQECFHSLGYREGDFPEAEKAAKEVLALPAYPGLTASQQEVVVAAIQEFFSRA